MVDGRYCFLDGWLAVAIKVIAVRADIYWAGSLFDAYFTTRE
jgi:hypothetical protein